MCLAFFSHKPEGVEKEKYQFNNLYALFAPFSATSVKVFLSYTNALGLSERVGGKKQFATLCMRVDPGKSSEPNWQRGWRTWTSLCYELYSATWLPNFQELVTIRRCLSWYFQWIRQKQSRDSQVFNLLVSVELLLRTDQLASELQPQEHSYGDDV